VSRLDALPHRLSRPSPTLIAAFALVAGAAIFFCPWSIPMTDKTSQIRRLNDMARTQPQIANAIWVMTFGVQHLLAGDDIGADAVQETIARMQQLRTAIAAYADWREGNDPYGEHDFGAFMFLGERLFFKLDYYHPDRDEHAPDPASVELCRRVLTIMRADEY
jgi:hypothetical protein